MLERVYEATWGRGFAALYDRMTEASEEAGFRDARRELIAQARGRTLELGAGTGRNLEHYPPEVTELVVTEPDPHMAAKLRAKPTAARATTIVEAGAQALPFPDDHFDTAVATLVLCTVPDQRASLTEIARVLRPGGKLLFLEHVRAQDPGLARWQDRLEKPWRLIGDGCHCNRDTVTTLRDSAFEVEDLEHGELPKAPPLVRPLVTGAAVLPA